MNKRLIMGVVLAKYLPNSAGHQLSVLHWLLGFRELGWDIWIVETLYSDQCRDANGNPCTPEASINLTSWRKFIKSYGFESRQSLFIDGVTGNIDALRRFAEGADLFLNYAGQFDAWEVISGVRSSVYLDVDPGYTQTWACGYGCDMNFQFHDYHVTIGSAYNEPWCHIPSTGHAWISTLPPISLSFYKHWKTRVSDRFPEGSWSTVTHWYGTGEVEFKGLRLRGKRESFLPLINLPKMTSQNFMVASDLQSEWEDYPFFSNHGWAFCASNDICESMRSYLDFIRKSRGEIGVAKEGYVTTQSGWLSDRSMAYLGCGRPVVAMDTGWRKIIGEFPGLRAFTTPEEAAQAVMEIEVNYEEATKSALELSASLFEAKHVISRLLSKLGIEFQDSVEPSDSSSLFSMSA